MSALMAAVDGWSDGQVFGLLFLIFAVLLGMLSLRPRGGTVTWLPTSSGRDGAPAGRPDPAARLSRSALPEPGRGSVAVPAVAPSVSGRAGEGTAVPPPHKVPSPPTDARSYAARYASELLFDLEWWGDPEQDDAELLAAARVLSIVADGASLATAYMAVRYPESAWPWRWVPCASCSGQAVVLAKDEGDGSPRVCVACQVDKSDGRWQA